MFGEKADNTNPSSTTNYNTSTVATIIDEKASFEGKMTFEGCVQINGRFKGEVLSSGKLIIGPTGKIDGEIEVGQIEIKGEVKGNIKAKSKIEVFESAQVYGDISSPSIVVKEGAIFEGTCSMGKKNVVNLQSHKEEAK